MKRTLSSAACCLSLLLVPYAWAQPQNNARTGAGTDAHPNKGTQAAPQDSSRDRRSPEHPGRSGARPESDVCAGPGAQNNPRCADSQLRNNPGGRSTPPGSNYAPGELPDPGKIRKRQQPS